MSWSDLWTALGLVAVIEGLALALAPRRMEDLLAALQQIPPDTRRYIGLAAIAVGVLIVSVARS
ncbi:MAG: DUF2065 domain-containing protein [Pseudomonadota bacterium]